MQSRSSQPGAPAARTLRGGVEPGAPAARTLRGGVEPGAIAITESETYQTLLARAHRQTAGVPPERIVRHVLSVTHGGDWPVQRDALDAVLRRCASTHTDEIQIVGRPRGRMLGLYAARRRGSRARPYRTLLRRIEPLDGSCECADFLRNSLALCKHLIAVLEDVVSKRRRGDVERELAPDPAPLRWDPVRPLTGPGDWLARIRWVNGTPDRDLRRWLRPGNGNGWTVAVPGASPQRLALVDRLLAALRDGNGEPALHALLQEERARLARQIQTASTRKHLNHALHTLKQSLYRYQHAGVERFLARGRLLLADDMGLGKTAQAIAACHALWHTGRVRRGLIIVPAALKPQWLREWQLFTDAPAAVVEGTPGQRRAAFEACRRGFLLGNYEQLIRDLDIVREWMPDIVVLDEAQRIKNWATRTALTVKRLDPPYRLVLTGTPMENRLDELASIVVVFSQWRRMLRLAHWATRDLLAREGVTPAFFTGEEGQKRRTQNIVDFHDDPACRVLFATDAGGVGLNLQRAASACINIELPSSD